MSPTRDRRKRTRNAPRPEAARKPEERSITGLPHRPLPEWRWRTFPVFFVFGLGLFIGVFAGSIGGIIQENGNGVPLTIVTAIAAIILGLGFSRFMTRWLLSRRLERRARP